MEGKWRVGMKVYAYWCRKCKRYHRRDKLELVEIAKGIYVMRCPRGKIYSEVVNEDYVIQGFAEIT